MKVLSSYPYLLEVRKTLQKDLDSLDICAEPNSMTFKKGKCQVLHAGHKTPMQQYRPEEEWLESYLAEKDLELLVNSHLNMS